MNTIKNSLLTSFLKAMQLQFFLSIMSLPVLVAWGLPFSVMTVIGNLVFTPLMSLFLCLSSLIFFTELLSLPNQWIIALLEKLFDLWMYGLSFGSTRWLSGIDTTGLIVCIATSATALIMLHHKHWGKPSKSWWIFGLLLLVPFAFQKVKNFWIHTAEITCLYKTVTLKQRNGSIIAFDHGALGEKKAATTWVQYTFLSEALKKCGSTTFTKVICPYPNSNTLQALNSLCAHATVETIELMHPPRTKKSYKEELKKLRQFAQKRGIQLVEEERQKRLYPSTA